METLIGGSILLNILVLVAFVLVKTSTTNQRRIAAKLWAHARATDQKRVAWIRIERDAATYEVNLLRRGDLATLVELPGDRIEDRSA